MKCYLCVLYNFFVLIYSLSAFFYAYFFNNDKFCFSSHFLLYMSQRECV